MHNLSEKIYKSQSYYMKLKPSFKKCTVKTEGNYYINYPQSVCVLVQIQHEVLLEILSILKPFTAPIPFFLDQIPPLLPVTNRNWTTNVQYLHSVQQQPPQTVDEPGTIDFCSFQSFPVTRRSQLIQCIVQIRILCRQHIKPEVWYLIVQQARKHSKTENKQSSVNNRSL